MDVSYELLDDGQADKELTRGCNALWSNECPISYVCIVVTSSSCIDLDVCAASVPNSKDNFRNVNVIDSSLYIKLNSVGNKVWPVYFGGGKCKCAILRASVAILAGLTYTVPTTAISRDTSTRPSNTATISSAQITVIAFRVGGTSLGFGQFQLEV